MNPYSFVFLLVICNQFEENQFVFDEYVDVLSFVDQGIWKIAYMASTYVLAISRTAFGHVRLAVVYDGSDS